MPPMSTWTMNRGFTRLSTMACSLTAHFCADFSGAKNLPKPPYVLLPKHQSMIDIILEGILVYRTRHPYPHYLMKHTLPAWLGVYGGIHVVRQQDAGQADRRRNIAALRRAQQVLAEKGVLVVHPEGTRVEGAVGPLQQAGIGMIVGWQKELGPIPLVPVGIRYEGQMHVRVGTPRVYSAIGERETRELRLEMARLSGLGLRDTPTDAD